MNGVWESFLSAAQTLSSAGPIKPRLTSAYSVYLATLQTEELPREVRDEFKELGSCMCSVMPMRGESAIQASVRKMSEDEAAGYALRIINLLAAISKIQMQPRQPVLRAVNASDA